MTKTITHVVVRKGNLVFALPKPFRHHHVLGLLLEPENKANVQGFLATDSKDGSTEFVDRQEAMRIAKKAKQLLEHVSHKNKELFSEDVWSSDLFDNGLEVHYDEDKKLVTLNQKLFVCSPYGGVLERMITDVSYNGIFGFNVDEFKSLIKRAHWNNCVYPYTELTLRTIGYYPDFILLDTTTP